MRSWPAGAPTHRSSRHQRRHVAATHPGSQGLEGRGDGIRVVAVAFGRRHGWTHDERTLRGYSGSSHVLPAVFDVTSSRELDHAREVASGHLAENVDGGPRSREPRLQESEASSMPRIGLRCEAPQHNGIRW